MEKRKNKRTTLTYEVKLTVKWPQIPLFGETVILCAVTAEQGTEKCVDRTEQAGQLLTVSPALQTKGFDIFSY